MALSATIALSLGLWAFWWEPASLRVSTHRLDLPRWPASLTGLRVAALADLHVGSPFNDLDRLHDIVERTNRTAPDLVLLLGDYVIHNVPGGRFVEPRSLAAALAKLRAPLGTWAVLGNHDHWLDAARVRGALEQAGIRVLENGGATLTWRGTPFSLVGVSDETAGSPDIARALASATDGAPILLMTHNPDLFPRIPPRVSLTVAGHTHGGQVRLPLFGRPIVPSRYGERYAIGHIVEQDRHLFVSSGIGTSILPVRFRVAPEVSVLELQSASANEAVQR